MAHDPLAFQTFVGVDLHKTSVTLAAVDPGGEVRARLTTSTRCVDRIDQFLTDLPGPVHLAVEACPFVEWFIDRYRSRVVRLSIADATELASLRGKRRKTDRNDALDIARRLARGECPLGWIANESVARLRKLGRQWHRLSRSLSRTKASMRGILLQMNLAGPGEITGESAQRWLLAQGMSLKEIDRRSFGELLGLVQHIERVMVPLKGTIIEECRASPLAGLVELLQSVPGIADVRGCIIAAEIGDFSRFPNANALEFWSGLTPDLKESAGRTVSGNITKAGSRTLRWAICQAGVCLCRSDASQERVRQRLIRRGVKRPKANVAIGRRLLRILWTMARSGEVYRMGQPTGHTAKANQARRARKERSQAA